MKSKKISNAQQAAKALGLKEIPEDWLAFLRSNWEIRPAVCACGGKWAWYRPRISGDCDMAGCTCHTEVDISCLINTKLAGIGSRVKDLIDKSKLTKDDIGKIVYSDPANKIAWIVTREEFQEISPDDIGWWTEIDDFDVLERSV